MQRAASWGRSRLWAGHWFGKWNLTSICKFQTSEKVEIVWNFYDALNTSISISNSVRKFQLIWLHFERVTVKQRNNITIYKCKNEKDCPTIEIVQHRTIDKHVMSFVENFQVLFMRNSDFLIPFTITPLYVMWAIKMLYQYAIKTLIKFKIHRK